MKNVKLNPDYSAYIRGMFSLLHTLSKGKQGEERRVFFDKWANKTKELRSELRNIGENVEDTVIYDDNGEGVTVIYREPFEFEGTKKELYEYLWENCATRICSEYDCTGKSFTSWYKVGCLGNNKWKIAEHFAVDV